MACFSVAARLPKEPRREGRERKGLPNRAMNLLPRQTQGRRRETLRRPMSEAREAER